MRASHPALEGLALLAEKLAAGLRANSKRAKFTVDSARSVLKNAESGRHVISRPMAEVLAALKERGFLTFEEALERGFEIAPYDDFIHAPKIHNLVQRLKKILPPSCLLKTKDGALHFTDPTKAIHVIQGSPHHAHFPALENTPTLPKKQSAQVQLKKAVKGPARLLTTFAADDILTREQIQDAIGASKATTNRWIRAWLRDGVLDQTGSGRATRYQIKR